MDEISIINDVQKLEQERKMIKEKRTFILTISIIIGFLFCFLLDTFEIIFLFILVGSLMALFLTSKQEKNFKKAYKQLVILETFRKVFKDIEYFPDSGLTLDIINNLGVLDSPDRYNSNDFISATYNNINFEAADILLEKKYINRKGKTEYKTIFCGQWYIFDFRKNFKSDVQILDKSIIYSKRNNFFDKYFNKIQLEDIEFNNEFSVYAKNDIDAFYILTPHVIQSLKDVKYKISGKLIFCFKDNKLHVGINNYRNSFEPNLGKPINIEQIEKQTFKEINDIINFINNLDNSLFRKEV